MALGVLGRSRATYDIDFLIGVLPEDVPTLVVKSSQHGFKRDLRWHAANPLLAQRMVRFRKSGVAIDFLLADDPHSRISLKRRHLHRTGGSRFYTVTPEDLVLMKLAVGRPRDWDDLLGVLLRQPKGTVHWGYLRRWSRRLGLRQEISYLYALLQKA